MTDARRSLPSVSSLLEMEPIRALLQENPRAIVVEAVREAVNAARTNRGKESDPDWPALVTSHLDTLTRRTLRPVINATGVVLHTNLGRAPLAQAAIEAVREVAAGYSNLEYDIDAGARGSRYAHCAELICELTGAEDAIVVNNCASALVLSLSALGRGREVLVSRGELVEIGGSFRVPDIMERSGATLVEVGTTNRTHLDDYRRAITSRTALIAKIHRSNFSMSGFVAESSVAELRPLAGEHDIPILHDLGSGLLISLERYGLEGEPIARDALGSGATVVMMSGDKLLGGPQAGIAAGSKQAIARMKNDPFARAFRVDKMTLAAMTATLELYRDPGKAIREVPALSMITASAESIRERCFHASQALGVTGIRTAVVESVASVGAGAFPAHEIPSFALAFANDIEGVESRLRTAPLPLIARIFNGKLLLDMRSVPSDDDDRFISAIASALA